MPAISVCVPVYNASNFINECIDSILAQSFEDFELLLVDDGSTDNTWDIIKSYEDKRIKAFRRPYDYIANLNFLLEHANGKYIARMDSDDIMLPERLSTQFAYMQEHPNVDVLGGGMELFGDKSGIVMPAPIVCIYDMINACCMAHPTVMIRKSTIRAYNLSYEEKYKYAEDYRLWMELFKRNAVFHNIQQTLIKYRISANQISSTKSDIQFQNTEEIKTDTVSWLKRKICEVSTECVDIKETGNKLSVIIPFLNEGCEVTRTAQDVRRTAGCHVDIIVVNDCSDDGYNYEADLAGLDVIYVRNEFRIGAAASKHKGAMIARTPYILILDAHMRCHTEGWHIKIIDALEQDDNRLLCCQTGALVKDEQGNITDKGVMIHDGAFVEFSYNHYLPGIRWNQSKVYSTKEIHQIPCVLGASYAASKRYWNRIRGLEGLMHYGCEEAFLSIKAWMEGGGCALLYNVIFGHIYRTTPPYRVVSSGMYYNSFVISNTLFPSSLRCMADSVGYQMSPSVFREISFWLSINSEYIKELRQYFINNLNCDIDRIIKLNAVETCEKEQSAMIERNRLESIVKYVMTQTPTHLGLYDGLMGQVLSLGIYLNYNQSDTQVESFVCAQVTQLCEHLLTDITTPYNFADGLCGIGWGLIYLIRHGCTNEKFEIELNFIDRKIQELAPERICDISLETGVCGIMCYVVNREDTKKMFLERIF